MNDIKEKSHIGAPERKADCQAVLVCDNVLYHEVINRPAHATADAAPRALSCEGVIARRLLPAASASGVGQVIHHQWSEEPPSPCRRMSPCRLITHAVNPSFATLHAHVSKGVSDHG